MRVVHKNKNSKLFQKTSTFMLKTSIETTLSLQVVLLYLMACSPGVHRCKQCFVVHVVDAKNQKESWYWIPYREMTFLRAKSFDGNLFSLLWILSFRINHTNLSALKIRFVSIRSKISSFDVTKFRHEEIRNSVFWVRNNAIWIESLESKLFSNGD